MAVLTGGLRRAPLHYRVAVNPTDDGEATLTAWWPETLCSLLPCPHRIERWRDGAWRVSGSREGYSTADRAARAFLEDWQTSNEDRARRWRESRR